MTREVIELLEALRRVGSTVGRAWEANAPRRG